MKTMVKVLIPVMVMTGASPALARTLKVNCNTGGTITKALENAKRGDTIQVTGTCKERFTITTDRLTLDGQGSAILDGGGGFKANAVFEGVITIDGARGVTIAGFTVQGGPDGITCKRGAACLVRNSILQDNADEGLQVSENSTAEVTDSTFRRNGEWGIVVFDNSSLLFHGTVSLTNNGKSGLGVIFTSTVGSFSGATIHLDNNAHHGILALGSFVHIDRKGGTVTMNNNKKNGVGLLDSVFMLWAGNLSIARNGGKGIYVGSNSSLRDFGATWLIKDNKGEGLAVENGGDVTMTEATITGNSIDVDLGYGAHATLKRNAIGTVTCDKSSRIVGDTACPDVAIIR
jgi:hypothetical protein